MTLDLIRSRSEVTYFNALYFFLIQSSSKSRYFDLDQDVSTYKAMCPWSTLLVSRHRTQHLLLRARISSTLKPSRQGVLIHAKRTKATAITTLWSCKLIAYKKI